MSDADTTGAAAIAREANRAEFARTRAELHADLDATYVELERRAGVKFAELGREMPAEAAIGFRHAGMMLTEQAAARHADLDRMLDEIAARIDAGWDAAAALARGEKFN